MTGPLIRKLCLCLVFIAGVLSIMATSPPPPPYHFQEVEIEPAYRCPGSDVAVRWALSLPASVTVAVGDTNLVTTTDGRTLLPAELLERDAPVATLSLRIDAEESGGPYTNKITTLTKERTIEKLAFHTRSNKFRMYNNNLWDEPARIVDIKVEQIRNFACASGDGSPLAWEVSPPSGPSFTLRAEDGYSASLDPPPTPSGEWLFRPKGGKCRLPASGSEPYLSVHLTAQCVAN